MRRSAILLAALTIAGTLVVPGTGQAVGSLTSEAVTVWQHRDAGSATGWDIFYSVLGRPEPTDPFTALAWHATGGPKPQAAPIAALAGDDKNPHIGMRNNVAIAVWQHAPGTGAAPGDWDIWWSRFDGIAGTWTAPAALAALSGDDYDPNIVIDTNGAAIAVWVHKTGATRQMYSSKLTGSTWSAATALPASGGSASIPEVAVTTVNSTGGALAHRAVAAWSDLTAGVHRMFYAIETGASWTAPKQIESGATGIGVSIFDVGFSTYSSTDTDPFGAFARIGVTGDGVGNALIVWSGDLHTYYSPGVVGAILNVAADTWTPMLTSYGSRYVGSGGCGYPDDAVTSGLGDFVSVYQFAGFIEHTFKTGGYFTFETYSYNHGLYDERPSNAPLSTTEMLSVNWGGPVGASSDIVWAPGKIVPGSSVSWGIGANAVGLSLVPGGLPGEDMFPEVASGFVPSLVSADAYSVNLTIDGASEPIRVRTAADARIKEPGEAQNGLLTLTLPMDLGEISIADNRASGVVTPVTAGIKLNADAASSIEHASLLGGMIELDLLQVTSSSSKTATGAPVSTSTGSIARLEIAGTEVPVPATTQVIPLPGGIGTLTILEEISKKTSTISEREVRLIHLDVILGGVHVDLVIASAYSGVSLGPAFATRPKTDPPVEPAL